MSLSSHLECKDFRRKSMPDLKELDESGFLFGTRKIEKLLGVSSRSRRNCPFTKAVTRPVSISTIHPLSAKDSIRYCFAWLTDFFLKTVSHLREGLTGVISPFLDEVFRIRSFVDSYRLSNVSFLSEEFYATLSCIFSISLV